MNDGKVGAGSVAEPANATDQALVYGCASFLGRIFVFFVLRCNGVDGHTGTIGCG